MTRSKKLAEALRARLEETNERKWVFDFVKRPSEFSEGERERALHLQPENIRPIWMDDSSRHVLDDWEQEDLAELEEWIMASSSAGH